MSFGISCSTEEGDHTCLSYFSLVKRKGKDLLIYATQKTLVPYCANGTAEHVEVGVDGIVEQQELGVFVLKPVPKHYGADDVWHRITQQFFGVENCACKED